MQARRYKGVMTLVLGVLVFVGCTGGDIVPDTVTLTVKQEGEGTVTPPEGEHSYEQDTAAPLEAEAAEGWMFSHWDGDIAQPSESETSIHMDEDKTVTAIFVPKPLQVPDGYASIQDAIDAAEDGDTIVVSPGTYPEQIDFLGKRITVQSEDPTEPSIVEETIIDGQGQGTVVTMDSGEDEESVLWGFTITGGDVQYGHGGGLVIDSSSPRIEGNLIRENTARRGAGAYVTNGADAVFERNLFVNNEATSRHGAAIYVVDQSEVTLTENTFSDHSGVDGVVAIGVATHSDCAATIVGNLFDSNTSDYGTGGLSIQGSEVTIVDNIFRENMGAGLIYAAGAITARRESTVEIRGNTLVDNAAESYGALLVAEDSTAIIADNTIHGNQAGTEEEPESGSGGGVSIVGAEAEIADNTIVHNAAWFRNSGGGGVYIRRSEAVIDANEIKHNSTFGSGGGIYLRGHGFDADAVAVVKNNSIAHNQAEGHKDAVGGGLAIGNIVEATVYANLIYSNEAEKWGGGVYVASDVPVYTLGSVPWVRAFCPPQDGEITTGNVFFANDHGGCCGDDVFFRELYPCCDQ